MMRCPLSYFGLVLVAVLAGCTVGPPYHQPPVAAPAQWKEGPVQDGVSPGPWWDLFGDAMLNRLEEQAVTANQELHRAVARVTEARALARVSTAELYPTVT